MASVFEKPLTVGKTDNYTFTVNAQWLAGETIANHSVMVDGMVIKNNSGVIGNTVGVSLTGSKAGPSSVAFEFGTSGGRSDCAKTMLIVISECQ